MFETRLKALLTAFIIGLLIILVRLAELQIVHADYYRARAERALILQPRRLPFVRGRILDRHGEVLVADEPCWDLAIEFTAIAAEFGQDEDEDATKRLLSLWRRSGHAPRGVSSSALAASLRNELEDMWRDIDAFALQHWYASDMSSYERCRAIFDRVDRVRRAVARRRGFDAPVAEERGAHPLMPALDAEQQIAARERFARYPWIHIERSSTRRYAYDTTAMAHILGRTGRVTVTDIEDDPDADDPFARYRGDEDRGISGVEWAGESFLRGRRGQIVLDRDGNTVLSDMIEAQNGRDVALTIDAELQRRLYHILGETVERISESRGGAIVVLDARSREVLALVSYPAYDPNVFDEQYATLRDDTEKLPLRFRAVANRYSPGSTIKPLTCLTGLANGVIDLASTETCTGYLFEEYRDRWRCWRIHGTSARKAHGPVNVVEALTGSCNVFMYRLGERIGVDGLCSAFDMVHIGLPSGIGLREENRGINPTPSWLMTYKNMRATPGLARLYAIGQGELSMTPLQVANLMATYASGTYRDVTLIDTETEKPVWTLPGSPAMSQAVRRGMYGVVNDPQGTAYRQAHFEHDGWVLVGKTGSATAHPWPTAYRATFVDAAGQERAEIVPAGSKKDAIERLKRLFPAAAFDPNAVEVAKKWPTLPPESGDNHSHAWFGGYLQARTPGGGPDWSRRPRIAFAALVEFGGSGGRTSGPLAKRISSTVLDVFGEELEIPPVIPVAQGP